MLLQDGHFQPVYMLGESKYSSLTLCGPAGHKQTAGLAIQHRVWANIYLQL